MARMLDALRRLEAANRLVSPSAPAVDATRGDGRPACTSGSYQVGETADADGAVTIGADTGEPPVSTTSYDELDEPPFEPTFGPLVAWERGDEQFAYHSHAIDDALNVLDALADNAVASMAPARLVTQPLAPPIDLLPLKAAALAAQTYIEPPSPPISPLDEFDPSEVVREHCVDNNEPITVVGLSDAPAVADDVLSTIQFAEQWATIALEEFGIDTIGETTDERAADVDQMFTPPSESAVAVEESPPIEVASEEPIVEPPATPEPLDESPPPSAKPTPQIETVNAASRPSASPAELAAMLDLSDATLAAQYTQLGERVVADLTSTTKTCAVLLSIEHQPHVTDVTLRTAMSICQTGKQVLVIDAALGDKQLTNGLAMPVEFGLAEVLKGRVPWQQAVRATATPGLCVLPAGRLAPPRLADDDHRLKEVLKELTSQWDLVLLDGGSLAEPSARYVAAATRNVYLVVRLGETDADAASRVAQRLDSPDIAMRGCIVTNACE